MRYEIITEFESGAAENDAVSHPASPPFAWRRHITASLRYHPWSRKSLGKIGRRGSPEQMMNQPVSISSLPRKRKKRKLSTTERTVIILL